MREALWVKPGKEATFMNIIKVTFVLSALAILAGCVAVPVEPGYYGGPPGYYPPAYYPPPAYYGPSFSFGFFGGGRGHWRH
jgi:hypothetical protein